MRTVTIEVAGLLSPLSALGVQKQLARLAGVTKAEVNYVAGSATVTFDDAVTDLSAISAVENNVGVFSSPLQRTGRRKPALHGQIRRRAASRPTDCTAIARRKTWNGFHRTGFGC